MRARSIVPLLALATTVTGCAALTERPLNQMVNDAAMTATIKSRLAASQGWATISGVSVDTYNDRVRLTGTVADEAEKAKIDALARQLAGDNRVVNDLKVRDGAKPVAASPTATR